MFCKKKRVFEYYLYNDPGPQIFRFAVDFATTFCLAMPHKGPSANSKFDIARFHRLKKIGKVQIFDSPEKHCILIPDFTIMKGLFQ